MIAQSPDLDTIFKRHRIHWKSRPEFRAFLEEGEQPGKALQTRLDHVANYRAARNEAMRELTEIYAHEFHPAGYQSPVPYESLLAEDIVISPGAPSAAR